MATKPSQDMDQSTAPQHENADSDWDGRRQPSTTGTEAETMDGAPPRAEKELSDELEARGAQGSGNQVIRRNDRKGMTRNEYKSKDSQQSQRSQNSQQLAPQKQQMESKGRDAPSVRLDMNLDVEIELKAKVKGDIQLSVL